MFNVHIEFKGQDIKSTISQNCTELSTQTCKYFVEETELNETLICDAKFANEKGFFDLGYHKLTLWIFFALPTMVRVCGNVQHNIKDAAGSSIAIRESSSLSIVYFFSNIGMLAPNWLTGPIVEHLSFGTDFWDCLTSSWEEVNDFKVPFFIQDAVFSLVIIITYFFLDVEIQKPEKEVSITQEFKWLLNPAPIGYIVAQFMVGTTVGALNTYLFRVEEPSTNR